MSNENSKTATPSPSTPSAKAVGPNRSMKSQACPHDAIPRADGRSGGYAPLPTVVDRANAVAGSKAAPPSLVVGATPSPKAPGAGLLRGRAGRFLGPGERVKAVRRGLRKREARLQRSMAHCREPRSRDLERWERMRAEIAEFQNTLAALLDGQSPPLSVVTGSRARELPDSVALAEVPDRGALAGLLVTSPEAP